MENLTLRAVQTEIDDKTTFRQLDVAVKGSGVKTEIDDETTLVSSDSPTRSTAKPFIECNTVECSLQEIKQRHLVPVFIRDNEPTISIAEFIEAAHEAVSDVYSGETILQPSIRLSHPIKGRIFEAKDKPAAQLQEWEKTIHYERAAFIIELPEFKTVIDGNEITLTIGGVKSYSEDNLYSRKGLSDEHFHFFIGFQNKVCTNLCVWSDGYMSKVGVKNIDQLKGAMKTLFQNYNSNFHLQNLLKLPVFELTESQFAHVLVEVDCINICRQRCSKTYDRFYLVINNSVQWQESFIRVNHFAEMTMEIYPYGSCTTSLQDVIKAPT